VRVVSLTERKVHAKLRIEPSEVVQIRKLLHASIARADVECKAELMPGTDMAALAQVATPPIPPPQVAQPQLQAGAGMGNKAGKVKKPVRNEPGLSGPIRVRGGTGNAGMQEKHGMAKFPGGDQ
jgi:hypothetical protein